MNQSQPPNESASSPFSSRDNQGLWRHFFSRLVLTVSLVSLLLALALAFALGGAFAPPSSGAPWYQDPLLLCWLFPPVVTFFFWLACLASRRKTWVGRWLLLLLTLVLAGSSLWLTLSRFWNQKLFSWRILLFLKRREILNAMAPLLWVLPSLLALWIAFYAVQRRYWRLLLGTIATGCTLLSLGLGIGAAIQTHTVIQTQHCLRQQIPRLLQEATHQRGHTRPLWLKQTLLGRCPGVPPLVRRILRYFSQQRLSSPVTRPSSHPSFPGLFFPSSDLLLPGLALWNQACPAGASPLFWWRDLRTPRPSAYYCVRPRPKEPPPNPFDLPLRLQKLFGNPYAPYEGRLLTRSRRLWSTCSLVGRRLFTHDEVEGHSFLPHRFVLALIFFQWLQQQGCPQHQARAFVRRALLEKWRHQGVAYLPSNSPLPLDLRQCSGGNRFLLHHRLFLRQDGVYFGPKKLLSLPLNQTHFRQRCTRQRRLFAPITKILHRHQTNLEKVALCCKNICFSGKIAVMISPQLRWYPIWAVLHALHRAVYERPFLLLGQRRIPFAGNPRMLPLRLWPPFATTDDLRPSPRRGSPWGSRRRPPRLKHPFLLELRLVGQTISLWRRSLRLKPSPGFRYSPSFRLRPGGRQLWRGRYVPSPLFTSLRRAPSPGGLLAQRLARALRQKRVDSRRLLLTVEGHFPFFEVLRLLEQARQQKGALPQIYLNPRLPHCAPRKRSR